MYFVDQLASTVDELPQLSYEEINFELAQLHDDFFNRQISDYISNIEYGYQYSPTWSYSSNSSDDYQPYSPPLKIKAEPIAQTKKWSPKIRSKRCASEEISEHEIDEIRVSFKLKRIKLGLSQKQAAEAVSKTVRKTSQTSLCRFENNQLHSKNMKSLAPFLKKWIQLN